MDSVTVNDVIRKNLNQKIIVQRKLRPGAYASLVEDMYTGPLKNVPENLRNLEVRDIVWSVGADCYVLNLGYRPDLNQVKN